MDELERSLTALAAEIEWPPTPELRLTLEPRRARLPARRQLVLALALLLLAFGIAMAVPPARGAILRFFHLQGVTIEQVETLPPAQNRSLRASLGRPVSAAELETDLGFRMLLPPGEESLQRYERGQTASVLLQQPTTALLTEFQSDVPAGFLLKKLLISATSIEQVDVAGDEGYWLSGRAHVVIEPSLPPRLAGNVLLWQHNGVTLRLEGRLTKEQALALARAIP
jgi:hypothetical protein